MDDAAQTISYVPTLINGAFLLGGALLGWIPAIVRIALDSKQKYAFSMIEKRFDINQQCYEWGEKIARVLHKENERNALLKKAEGWYYKNSLFLSPSVRKALREIIFQTGFYEVKLQNSVQISRTNGANSPEALKANQELKKAFDDIMDRIKRTLEDEVDASFWNRQP